ncbi:MAG TPA: tellurite resistance TerB family protein [Beijerinckiaceae bacterium]|nr:tellurite resistance TerB family protein [Beijerinckiaceae bacterium]
MFDARRLLDALLGATAGPAAQRSAGYGQGQTVVSAVLHEFLRPRADARQGAYVERAKDFLRRHPVLAEAAITTVGGMLMTAGKRRALALGAARLGGLARFGGLALVAGLAYTAYQTYQAGKARAGQGDGGRRHASPLAFDPASLTEDDALLYARAMIAAVSADGRVADRERERILKTVSQAGIDPEMSHWLRDELEAPLTVDELADAADTPEKGARIYAAARLAIDPDTLQEREFLRELGQLLDLDPQLVRHIDDAAAGARV